MRAVFPEETRQNDLTMRAQIRDAAIRRFPVDGFKGTTVRSLAGDVGASPGLVLHHFGSKDGLRTQCDEFVIRMMGETKREALRNGTYKDGSAIATTYKLMEPHLRYLAWTLTDGGDASSRIFDDLLEDAIAQLDEGQRTGLVNQIEDVRSQAAVLVVMQLGGLVLHEHFSRALGVDTLSTDGVLRAAPYALRLFSGELFNREVMADAAKALEDAQTPNPTKDKE
jgi:AcrR family transcriptional regulator